MSELKVDNRTDREFMYDLSFAKGPVTIDGDAYGRLKKLLADSETNIYQYTCNFTGLMTFELVQGCDGGFGKGHTVRVRVVNT